MRPRFRRSIPLIIGLLVAVVLQPGGSPRARAQSSPVTLRLAAQSAWNGPKRPLTLSFDATNQGTAALTGLSVVLTILAPATSRSVYELSLRTDATGVMFAYPTPEAGTLAPGETRRFRVQQNLDIPALEGDSALYPLKVELWSQNVTVATLRTPMVYLIEPPQIPLHLAWTWVLSEPVQVDPSGLFHPGPIVGDIAPGGRIDAMVTALDALTPKPVDVVVSPVLADELLRMSGGFRIVDRTGTVQTVPAGTGAAADAARVLAALRRVVGRPGTELVALPMGDARIPALYRAGLGGELSDLMLRGRARVGEVLGAPPVPSVFRPPYSELDPGTLAKLASEGASTMLVDPGFVPQQPGLVFSPAPVSRLTGAGSTVSVVIPDAGLTQVTQAIPGDPMLAARAGLGELAAIWFEHPGTAGRGAAVLFREGPSYPPAFFQAFGNAVAASPWLRTVTASTLTSLVAEPGRNALGPRAYRGLSPTYVSGVSDAQRALDRFALTVLGARPLLDQLRADLLMAVGDVGITSPDLGELYVGHVRRTIRSTYEGLTPPQTPITLPSQRGAIPLLVRNGSPYTLRVTVHLVADRRLQFPTGSSRTLTLTRNQATLFRIPVRAETTGRFPIKVQIESPGGPCAGCTIAESQVVVRSTAYNRVALFLTIGAALFLLAWWGRRFLPRGRS